MNRNKQNNYRCKKESGSWIKKGHTHATHGLRPIADRHSMLSQSLGQTSLLKKKQNTLAAFYLNDQSQPSPRIQEHTVAAMGGRLDSGGGGEEGEEEEKEEEERKTKR